MAGMKLRWYQDGAVNELFQYFCEHDGAPCVELPTGAGKTPVAAAFIHLVQSKYPGTRVLVLAHVQELVEQNFEKLKIFWPEANAGIYSAGLRRRDTENDAIFASIQSVRNKALELGRFDFILIDEAHRIPLKGDGGYRQFIDAMRKINPHVRIGGLTATPYRLDGGEVCGPKYILNDIIYRADVARLVDEGYLCRPIVRPSTTMPDFSGVKVSHGDYVESQLDEVFSEYTLVEQTVDEIMSLAHDRKHVIIFGSGSKHVEALQRALKERHGYDAPIILGNTKKSTRKKTIEDFKSGKHRFLLNINVLSEGFDAPMVDCVVLLRPTKSPGLYYQQVGRGFRLHPDKSDFLVLDFASNVVEHGPVDAIKPPGRKKGGGSAPMKVCKNKACGVYVAAQAKECPECGYEFPEAEAPELRVNHATVVHDVAILSSQQATKWEPVDGWKISRHEKQGKPPSLKVEYRLGMSRVTEWILLEHGSMQRARAVQWWTDRGGSRPAPRSVNEALDRQAELSMPSTIAVKWSSKFPEVLGYRYDKQQMWGT